jgi:hypothetical protein
MGTILCEKGIRMRADLSADNQLVFAEFHFQKGSSLLATSSKICLYSISLAAYFFYFWNSLLITFPSVSSPQLTAQKNETLVGPWGDNFSPRMPCQWYVRGGGEGKRRILVGQSVPPTPFGMGFGRLKLSPLSSVYPIDISWLSRD